MYHIADEHMMHIKARLVSPLNALSKTIAKILAESSFCK